MLNGSVKDNVSSGNPGGLLLGKTINYKISDLRKIDHLNDSQEEFKIP